MTYITIPLNADHDRSAFSCGDPKIDDFFRNRALSHMQKTHTAVVFVLLDKNLLIQGFYTLSNNSIPRDQIPEAMRKKMPYDTLPVTLIGQLAVHAGLQNQGIGTRLLMDALVRSYDVATQSVASIAVVLDAATDKAAAWYQEFGFIPLPDHGRLFLPMKTIADMMPKPTGSK